MNEKWKIWAKHPNWQISTNGRARTSVMSKYSPVRKKVSVDGFYYPPLKGGNYLYFGDHYSIHRAVAETWIENPDDLPCVNHKDGNKKNNNVENLEWVTYKQNSLHAVNLGLIKTGVDSPMYNKKGINHPCHYSNLGNSWNTGKHHSVETRQKISEKLKNNKNGSGHKVSEESRKLMSQRAKEREAHKKEERGV